MNSHEKQVRLCRLLLTKPADVPDRELFATIASWHKRSEWPTHTFEDQLLLGMLLYIRAELGMDAVYKIGVRHLDLATA